MSWSGRRRGAGAGPRRRPHRRRGRPTSTSSGSRVAAQVERALGGQLPGPREQRRRLRGVRRGAPRGRDRHRLPALPDRHRRDRCRHRRGRHPGPRSARASPARSGTCRSATRRSGVGAAGRAAGRPRSACRRCSGRWRCPSSARRWPRPRRWRSGPDRRVRCATGSRARRRPRTRPGGACPGPGPRGRRAGWLLRAARRLVLGPARRTLEQRLLGPVRGPELRVERPRDRGRRAGRGGAAFRRGLLRRARAAGLRSTGQRVRTSWIALPSAVTGSTNSGSKAISAAPRSTESRPRAGTVRETDSSGGRQGAVGEAGVRSRRAPACRRASK